MAAVTLATATSLLVRAATTSTSPTATSSANPQTEQRSPTYRVVGIILAISSGLFIGVSFVLKKVGLLRANKKYNEEAGEGYGYLKNTWWWSGMTLMIIGEICNFVAYAFVDAILVTPMGSLSVVVTTILSAIFLKERLSFVGKVGCFNCIIGSVVIVVNSPKESSVATIQEMQSFVVAPGFLSYGGVIIVGCIFIALWAGPRYGKKSMLVYLSVCSLIGGLSVVATQGLGAAIVAQASGTPQFNQWFLYVLLVFVIATLVTEIIYLNKALNIFNAALVTPTYYVFFTSATIITSAILFRGFKGTSLEIVTIIMGFLQICSGVVLLQLSKSAKDVPDAALFKGDLDQVRTVAEQEEHESEPKADAIRGASALIRSISKSRLKREAEEAKRLREEHLEPIGENEEVQWDGLRRRKTVVNLDQTPIRRQKTIHPPLGMSRFPNEHEYDAESHDLDNDHGLFPNFRRRAQSILTSRRSNPAAYDEQDGKGDVVTNMVPLSTIASERSTARFTHDDGDLSQQQHVFSQSADLNRGTPTGLSSMQDEDTAYISPSLNTTAWTQASPHIAPGFVGGPTPPPHARRQFSFQNVFSRRRTGSGEVEHRPVSSNSSHGLFGGLRKSSALIATEEESLGLVQGDSATSRAGAAPQQPYVRGRYGRDGSDGRDNEQESGERGGRSEYESRGQQHMDDGYEDADYDDDVFGLSPDRTNSPDGYETIHGRYPDSDGGGGRGPGGAAFV